MGQRPQQTRTMVIESIGVGGLSLLIYGMTLAPTVLFADGGEFQFVPWLPGIAHPTGYPLYTLLGWLFSHLFPVGEVAWRFNLFSALWGAGAIAIVYLITYYLSNQLFPDYSPLAYRLISQSQAIIAEVYTLHACFIALILGACLRLVGPIPPPGSGLRPTNQPARPFTFKEGLPLALLVGFGLTHHVTTVLLLPGIVVCLRLAKRLPTFPVVLKLGAAAAAPLVLYFYLPLIALRVPYVALQLSDSQTLHLYENTWTGFLGHISGQVFADNLQVTAVGWERFRLTVDFLRQQVGWGGGLLGLIGMLTLRRWPSVLWLTLASFGAFWLFNFIYTIGDFEVLFIGCWLILSVWIGLSWFYLADMFIHFVIEPKRAAAIDNPTFVAAARRMEQRMGEIAIISFTSLSLILPVTLLVTRYNLVDQSENTIARTAWEEILAAPLPDEAVLVSNDRNEMMPLWYYQFVEGRQPSWLGLFPLITPDPEFANVGRVVDEALASGRPVYLIKPMQELAIKVDLRALAPLPHAQLVEVTAFTPKPTYPVAVSYGEDLRLLGYEVHQQGEMLAVTLYWQPQRDNLPHNYTSYVHVVDANGLGLTQSDHLPGGEYYPSRLWVTGEVLRDAHEMTLPANRLKGESHLVVGAYYQPGPGVIENLGEGQVVGEVVVD